MKRIIMDLDNTICFKSESYETAKPNIEVISKLKEYKDLGYEIVIHTARNMRTYAGQVGLINVHTLPKILTWLEINQVPFDEVIIGKPWCGNEGFYVDDRALRPNEFIQLGIDEVEPFLSGQS